MLENFPQPCNSSNPAKRERVKRVFWGHNNEMAKIAAKQKSPLRMKQTDSERMVEDILSSILAGRPKAA